MGRWTAYALDRFNVRVVRWRVGDRQPAVDPADVRSYMQALPEDPFVDPEPWQGRPHRIDARGRAQIWAADQSDWRAVRYAARGETRAALVLLHGWLATSPQFALMRSLAEPLRRAGVELWMPRLPAHGERTPPGAVSGERGLSADLVTTAESLRLAVGETVALARWLRSLKLPVGVWGVSLGGWVATLTCTIPGAVDAAVLWTPVVEPVESLRHSPLADAIRTALRDSAIDDELLSGALAKFSPLRRRPAVDAERILVVGARYDNVVSADSLRRLESRWGVPVHWHEHGHISLLWSPVARRLARRFVARTIVDSF